MDHSYSTEREKVQKTDHSYFTVAKKTPKVVLRKAQFMKEHQESNRTSIGQDHSYVRPDHVLHLADLVVDEADGGGNDEDVGTFVPLHLPKNDAQTLPSQTDDMRLQDRLRSFEPNPSSRVRSHPDRPPTSFRPGFDLDNIDTQISGIRLDHAYDLKISGYSQRRSIPASTIRSRIPDASRNAVAPCRDQLLSLRLHDHTYLGTKIVDKA